ncbi:lipoprotein OmlA [Gluconacetobacter azotocaptans DSM 13594]|nr:lipoprotein OmlA [Gluconacetobacter azotocaptans DSM 13594]
MQQDAPQAMRSSPDVTPTLRPIQRLLPCAVVGLGLFLSGCAVFQSRPVPRGSLVEADDYTQLKPGVSTRSDTMDLLGSPTTRATFDDNTWIYISMTTMPTPVSFPSIRKQQVLVLNFDNGGVLRNMRTLSKADARYVGMVQDVTPTPGTKINVLQQILGNVGRYNPMSNMNSTFGGSTGPMGSNSGPGHGGTGNTLP